MHNIEIDYVEFILKKAITETIIHKYYISLSYIGE